MASVDFNVGGTLEATTITASVQFTGSGAGLTNIPASSISSLGASNAAVITSGGGALTTEAHLANVRGGTGTDSSGSTGIPHVSSGTWTYSGIASADLAVGFSVTNAQTTATSSNTASTIVSRDASGNFAAGNVTTTKLTQNATTVSPNGSWVHQVANVQTTNNSATSILSLTTVNSSVLVVRVLLSATDESDVSNNTGALSYIVKGTTNGSGSLTISSLAGLLSILDSNVSNISSTVTSSGANNLTINVVGVSSKTIDWFIEADVISQA